MYKSGRFIQMKVVVTNSSWVVMIWVVYLIVSKSNHNDAQHVERQNTTAMKRWQFLWTADGVVLALSQPIFPSSHYSSLLSSPWGGSVAEWLACWTRGQKARVQIAVVTLSGNSLRQTVRTHCASVHQASKSVAALLRVAGVTASLAESNGSLPPGSWLTSPAGWLPRTGIGPGTLRSVIE